MKEMPAKRGLVPDLLEVAGGEVVLGLGHVGVVGPELLLVDEEGALVVHLHLEEGGASLAVKDAQHWRRQRRYSFLDDFEADPPRRIGNQEEKHRFNRHVGKR